MSNYNSTLQTNNSSLEEIINQLNAMPDAGGMTPTGNINITEAGEYDVTDYATATVPDGEIAITESDLSINESTGVVTAKATVSTAGFVAINDAFSRALSLPTQAAQTITPSTTNKTIAAGKYLTGVQTIKGDANLVPGNIVSGKSIFGVVGTATTGSDGGVDTASSLIDKTITSYTNNNITEIGPYAFYNCRSLTTISLSACINLGSYAFQNCTGLTTINFPACVSIENYAFSACSSLTTAIFPSCTIIGGGVFQKCVNLSSISFPVCTSISASPFHGCSKLTRVSFPACITLGTYAFDNCINLTSVSFPVCTSIGSYAFYGCSKLTTVSFPACINIASYAFQACSSLAAIYLMASTVCVLSNSNAFSKTNIWSNKGLIYVPTSLVADYKMAPHWSYFSNRIFGR